MRLVTITLLALPTLAVAQPSPHPRDSLVATERAFARASVERGTRDAFLAFIADDGILFRPRAVPGKEALRASPARGGSLVWRPIFADISRAGDLGYTTGPWESRRSPSDSLSATGHFITVWRKQPAGAWRFVIDLGVTTPPWPDTSNAVQWAAAAPQGTRDTPPADTASARDALLHADRALAAATRSGVMVAALAAAAHPDARFYRNGLQPILGVDALRRTLAGRDGALDSAPSAAHVARSADLGYTYGTYTRERAGGNYMRIWRRDESGAWRVALEVLNPIAPGQ